MQIPGCWRAASSRQPDAFKEPAIDRIHLQGDTPRMGSGISTATIPAAQLAGMRAAEDRTERPELLHPLETPRPERAGRAARFRTILGRTLVRLVEPVISWDQRRRDRRLLASLDDRALRDIGIDRTTAERDGTTSSWRLR